MNNTTHRAGLAQILLAVAALGGGHAAASGEIVFFYDAENGVTPEDVGMIPFGPVSGQLNSTAGVPGLGDAVWEMSVNGSEGDYLLPLDGLADLGSSFRFTAHVRGLNGIPSGNASGTLNRNRPDGAASSANVSNLQIGEWNVLSLFWDSDFDEFRMARWRVDHQTGELTLVRCQTADFIFTPTPGASQHPNSISIRVANNGSTFLRTQWDNLVFENLDTVCRADIAPPFGVLDLSDVTAFASGMVDERLDSDITPAYCTLDLNDVTAFIALFLTNCAPLP